MKKRLRKKKHRQEYADWGRQVVIDRAREEGFEDFLDTFVLEAIEAHGCFCGNRGNENSLDVIVELGREAHDRDCRMRSISAWLDRRSDVATYQIGPLFDLWHHECPTRFESTGTKFDTILHWP